MCQTPHRAHRIDRMDHCPAQREEHHAIPFEVQLVKLAHSRFTHSLDLGENGLNLHLDQLTASRVRNSELQSSLTPIWGNDRVAAVNDSRGWSREARKDHSGSECDPDDIEQCLDRYQSVRGRSYRDDIPVSDRCKSVDAEKERSVKRLTGKTPRTRVECTRPQGKK